MLQDSSKPVVIEKLRVCIADADTTFVQSFQQIFTFGHGMDIDPHVDNSASSMSCHVVRDHGRKADFSWADINAFALGMFQPGQELDQQRTYLFLYFKIICIWWPADCGFVFHPLTKSFGRVLEKMLIGDAKTLHCRFDVVSSTTNVIDPLTLVHGTSLLNPIVSWYSVVSNSLRYDDFTSPIGYQ